MVTVNRCNTQQVPVRYSKVRLVHVRACSHRTRDTGRHWRHLIGGGGGGSLSRRIVPHFLRHVCCRPSVVPARLLPLAAALDETADLAPIRFQHQLCLEVNLLPSPPPHRTAPHRIHCNIRPDSVRSRGSTGMSLTLLAGYPM